MNEWLSTPDIVIVALAVVGLIWKAARWTSRVDNDLGTLMEVSMGIRDDIKQLYSRLPAQGVTVGGRLSLTDFGEMVAERLEAQEWAANLAGSLLSDTRGIRPFEVDEFCETYTDTKLDEDWEKKVAMNADQFGTDKDSVRTVLRVVLRDELLKRST